MQSKSGTGNVAATPLKTIATSGPYLLQLLPTTHTAGGISIGKAGAAQILSGVSLAPSPLVLVHLVVGDVIEYSVGFTGGAAWAFDFVLFDLSATPEIA